MGFHNCPLNRSLNSNTGNVEDSTTHTHPLLSSQTCVLSQATHSVQKTMPVRWSLSMYYWFLLGLHSQQDPPYLAKKRDLNTTFTEKQKGRIPFFSHKTSLCAKKPHTRPHLSLAICSFDISFGDISFGTALSYTLLDNRPSI